MKKTIIMTATAMLLLGSAIAELRPREQGPVQSQQSRAVVMLHCEPGAYSGSSVGYAVNFADSSPNAPTVAIGESCALALEALADAGFSIMSAQTTDGNNGWNYLLVRGTF